MKKSWPYAGIVGLCLLTAACSTGKTISFAHSPILPCPAAQPVPSDVAAEFTRYENDPLMKAFYKHYLEQQRQLSLARQPASVETHCPSAFWVQNDVAAKFRQYPPGHFMREFFKAYVAQQRAIDAYYAPAAAVRKQ